MLDDLDARYLTQSPTCLAAAVSLGATAVTLNTMRGVFAFVAIMLLVSVAFAALELLIYRYRFSSSPCKVCRRLNIFCGYHYDKPRPPELPRGQWDISANFKTIGAAAKSLSRRNLLESQSPGRTVVNPMPHALRTMRSSVLMAAPIEPS